MKIYEKGYQNIKSIFALDKLQTAKRCATFAIVYYVFDLFFHLASGIYLTLVHR